MLNEIIRDALQKVPKKQLAHTILDIVWDKAEKFKEEVIDVRKAEADEQAELKKQISEILEKLK